MGIASIISLVLLAFGYRDVSMELLGMFFLTLIGLPLSTYLITKQKTFMIVEEDDGVVDIVGRFRI